MLFNVDKCKVIHYGYKNTQAIPTTLSYLLALWNETWVFSYRIAKKVSKQCLKAANTTYKIMGMMNRTYSHKSRLQTFNHMKTIVRR